MHRTVISVSQLSLNMRADMDGQLRLMEGGAGAGFEFGRLEIFLRGFWSNICSGGSESFTPDSAQVACRLLGYDGGASLVFRQPFTQPFTDTDNPVSISHSVVTIERKGEATQWRNESACSHTNPMQTASHRGSHTRPDSAQTRHTTSIATNSAFCSTLCHE